MKTFDFYYIQDEQRAAVQEAESKLMDVLPTGQMSNYIRLICIKMYRDKIYVFECSHLTQKTIIKNWTWSLVKLGTAHNNRFL